MDKEQRRFGGWFYPFAGRAGLPVLSGTRPACMAHCHSETLDKAYEHFEVGLGCTKLYLISRKKIIIR